MFKNLTQRNNRSAQRKWPQTPEVSRCPLVNHGVWHLPSNWPPTYSYTLWILLYLMPSALKGKNESHHLPFPFSPCCHIHFSPIQFGSHPQTDWGIAFQSLICCNEKREGTACECSNRISWGRRRRHRPFQGGTDEWVKLALTRRGGHRTGPRHSNPPDLLLVMCLVFVLTNNFTKLDPPNRYRLFFIFPFLLLLDMRALDRAGYELNTIGSFEVCPTNNWLRMLDRKGQFVEGKKKKTGIIDFFSSFFPSLCCFYSFF